MRLYLDDDSASALLARRLRQAGHDIRVPSEIGMAGDDDPVHLAQAIREDRTLLSHNHYSTNVVWPNENLQAQDLKTRSYSNGPLSRGAHVGHVDAQCRGQRDLVVLLLH